ncbi:MAG: 2'-5' RNA ligase family protein [Chloroflexota bacterium]|nr:MAG: 2'-5' RNA ligase family protein [Chloroflexota bacterium]
MGYAVLLYFDDKTEQSILDLRSALAEQGVTPTLEKASDRPHISLAGFPNNIDGEELVSIVREYANNIQSFRVHLSSIGIFPTPENVLFLSPTPTLQLLTCHKEFHQRLAGHKFISSLYYVPENWTPHCSVEMNIPENQLPKAIEYCKKIFKPIYGQFQEIGVIKYRPIKSLAMWHLTVNSV